MEKRKCLCPRPCPTNGWLECPISTLQEENYTLRAEVAALKHDPDWKSLWAKLQAAVTRAEQAEAELVELKALVDMLERGGVRIVSAGGSYTLAEFRDCITELSVPEEKPPPWPDGMCVCSACGMETNTFHWYPPNRAGFRLCRECNPGGLRAELAALKDERTPFGDEDQTCGTCAHSWAGTCWTTDGSGMYEWAKDRPAPADQTCRYATSQWTRKPDAK